MKSIKSVDLKTAVGQIKQACDDCREHNERSPFFFVVGAGISHPPVPLALEIEEYCMAVAKKYGRGDESVRRRPIDTYSHWFEKAYPQPARRQNYLRELIDNKFISHANFRLAHLLLNQTITNLIVTPNFDDFLSRALMLFGKPHIVCDHPNTVERIDPESDDIQVVHVHGTYWFYDCCNLKEEIKKRSQRSTKTTSDMASFLDRVLMNRSPIVIGYSGWEDDVVMAALKRRLTGPHGRQNRLRYNLYWFCYNKSSSEILPEYLKFHPQVYFVLPASSKPDKKTKIIWSAKNRSELEEVEMPPDVEFKDITKIESQEPMPSLREVVDTITRILKLEGAELMEIRKIESREPTLPAIEVFDELIRTFMLEAPQLTTEPLKFFAKYLRNYLPQDDVEKVEGDSYSFNNVIKRIEHAYELEIESIQKEKLESQLEEVRDALRRSQYREAIQQASTIVENDWSESQIRELINAIWSAASNLSDNSDEELKGYDLVIALSDSLPRQVVDVAIQTIQAKALLNKGIVLSKLNRYDDAIAINDEIVKRFDESVETALREQVAKAMMNKALTLLAIKSREKEAFKLFDEIIERFGKAKEPELYRQAEDALHLIASVYILVAKNDLANNNEKSARGSFKEAQKKIINSTATKLRSPRIHIMHGYIEFLLGNQDKARTILTKVSSSSSAEHIESELFMDKKPSLPHDEEFRKFFRSISPAKES